MNKRPFFRSRKTVGAFMVLALLAGCFLSCWSSGNAQASEYDPQAAGNPIHVAAYLLFPVGVLLDYCFMRPTYWLVQREPFSTLFGYEYLNPVDKETKQDDPVEERLEASENR